MRVGIAVLLAWLGFAGSALAEKRLARVSVDRKYILSALIAAFLLSIDPASAASFAASFKWCSQMPRSTTSPRFSLSGVPKGTAKLSLYMTDHDASYNHGGGVVPYTGKNIIPCGAIAGGWVGPFPPGGQVHTYEFSVKALDSSGNTLGTASATRRFPEK